MHGIHVPLVTPFTAAGAVDAASLDRLARRCLDEGAAGLVALATTGEGPLLDAAEQRTVLEICRAVSIEYGVPLTVGAGTMGTADSLRQARERAVFADALLVVVPYYLRPTDDGVLDHFTAIGAAVDVPLIAYNVPYRTGKALSAPALHRLLELDCVSGIKHCPGAVDQETLGLLACEGGHQVLCGDDLYLFPLMQLGAVGGITASACLAPAAYADLYEAVRTCDHVRARALHEALLPMAEALSSEPSPTVLKAALAELGVIDTPAVRPPLHAPSPEAVQQALAAMPFTMPVTLARP
jgi:4-hydroxy-tetrahydrodipicolinate synthase